MENCCIFAASNVKLNCSNKSCARHELRDKTMKKSTTNLMIALCATLMCVNFTSCNKDPEHEPTPEPEPTEEFTIIGTWKSTEWFEVDDDGESDGEYTDEFYVIFMETTAKLYLYDCNDNEIIESRYTFREEDNSIIYFDNPVISSQGTNNNYGLRIIGKVNETTKRLIIQVDGYEDGSHQLYYFRKQ